MDTMPPSNYGTNWILTESVRRVWLLLGFTQNIYLVVRNGWVECSGGVMFTAREGSMGGGFGRELVGSLPV